MVVQERDSVDDEVDVVVVVEVDVLVEVDGDGGVDFGFPVQRQRIVG